VMLLLVLVVHLTARTHRYNLGLFLRMAT